jgi:hypothetical protein
MIASTSVRHSHSGAAWISTSVFRGLLDERAWIENQMFFALGQGTAEASLQSFQHLALLGVELLARRFALWRDRGRRIFRFERRHLSPGPGPALDWRIGRSDLAIGGMVLRPARHAFGGDHANAVAATSPEPRGDACQANAERLGGGQVPMRRLLKSWSVTNAS